MKKIKIKNTIREVFPDASKGDCDVFAVFDFDETVAITDSNIHVVDKDSGERKRSFSPDEYAVKFGNLSPDQAAEIKARIAQEEEYMAALKDVETFQDNINSHSGVRLFGGLEDIANAIPGLNKFSSAFEIS